MKDKIKALLEEYLEAPEAWSDNVMIEVNPKTLECSLYDDDDADLESSENDYWPVMDLIQMSVENPGEWEIDGEAVGEMISTY